MKNNKAIEILQSHTNLGYGIVIEGDTKEIKEALNLAIKALEALENCTYFRQDACGKCTYYDWQSAMARDYGVRGEVNNGKTD